MTKNEKVMKYLQKKYPLEKNTPDKPTTVVVLDGQLINHMTDDVKQYLEKHCPTTAEICENKERKYYEYCIANAEYYKEFIDRFEFGTSYTQHIPPVVFEGTKTYVTTFLRYLFE